MLMGAGAKMNQPIVLRRGSVPYRGFLEGRRQLRGSQRALALYGAREAPEDLRQDHARVAAGAHQAAVRRELGDLAHLGGVRLLDVLDRGLKRQQHVRARVAVGDREHVEPVHLLVVGREPAEAPQEGPLEEGSVHPRDLVVRHVSAALRERPGRSRSPARQAR